MDGIFGFIAGLSTVELVIVFLVGAIVCFWLGRAPSFVAIFVLILSAIASIKFYWLQIILFLQF